MKEGGKMQLWHRESDSGHRAGAQGRAQQSEDAVDVFEAVVTWDNTSSHIRIPHHLQAPLPHGSASPSVSMPVLLLRQGVLIFAFLHRSFLLYSSPSHGSVVLPQ